MRYLIALLFIFVSFLGMAQSGTAGDFSVSELTGMKVYLRPVNVKNRTTDLPITGLKNKNITVDTLKKFLSLDVTSKVDKVTGKSLSTNDFTNILKGKLDGVAIGATANSTDGVLLDLGNHTGSLPLGLVSGLSTALNNKVSVVFGKDLSSNDFTAAYRNKIETLPTGDILNARRDSTNSILTNKFDKVGGTISGSVGIGVSLPVSKLQVNTGDIELGTVGNGVIITAPNGTRWRIMINNTGNLSTTSL
jgi:hypothetical protein